MIFALGQTHADPNDPGPTVPALIVGVTLDELRAMLDEPGRTVTGEVRGELHVIVFGAVDDATARALVAEHTTGDPIP